ncbi:MAG TPA: tetratricopeptide repeat protein [Ktedonobacteraceae bacterium]|nr:tetratricopeptide repeat protein [Ktedonobacteraceae bacterium]
MESDTEHNQDEGSSITPLSTEEAIAVSTQSPAELEKMLQQADKYLAGQRWSQAEQIFQELLSHNTHDEAALQGLAQAYDALNRHDDLLSTAQSILEISPNSAQGLAYKARALQKLERLSEATIANDQALLLDNTLGLAWINRSGLQLLQQKFPEALRNAQRAVELAPNDPRSWANKGVALLNFGRLLEALEAFNQSLTHDPNGIFSLQMKGEILCKLGRLQEALPVIQHGLSINSTNVTSLIQGIQTSRALEMYELLTEYARQLTTLTPKNPFAWDNYMRGHRGLGQFEEANEALDQLLALDPSSVRTWTLKADTLYRLGRYREATAIAEKALRIDQGYSPAHRIHEKAVKLMYQRKEKKKT